MKAVYLAVAALIWAAAFTPVSAETTDADDDHIVDDRSSIYGFCKNAAYLNVLGPAIPVSVNYERILTQFTWVNWAPKLGGMYLKFPQYNDLTIANASFEVNTLVGSGSHLFVLGVGWAGYYGSYFSDTQDKTKHYGVPTTTATVGYRFQSPSPGIFFQIGFTTTTIIAVASSDLKEMLIANAAIYGLEQVFGKTVNFTVPSVSLGYSF